MLPYIIVIIGLVLFIALVNNPYVLYNQNELLTDGTDFYIFVRWNWYCVNGMTGHNNDVYVQRVKVHNKYFAEPLSGEFGDNSDRYKLVSCGKGIRPPKSAFI